MRRIPAFVAAVMAVTLIISTALPASASSRGLVGSVRATAGLAAQSGQAQSGQQQQEQEQQRRYEQIIVVTASRSAQLLLDAPTALSVIEGDLIATSPAANYADLLRSVPGLNVSQTSARDINVTSRAATNTLETSQLVLVDGRTIYQDFFGFVLWDVLPIAFNEIEQIEVQKGPSSAVWGANAMTGVINLITKTPRSMGNFLSVRGGGGEQGTGFGSLLFSAVEGPWAYKLSGSYFTQDAWARPESPAGLIFPDARNRGAKQPKFDARVDYDLDASSNLSFSGGYAGTSGIIHTGLGPFDIEDGSWFGYFRGDYNRNEANVRFYANLLDARSSNLLSPLRLDFQTGTYDFSGQNSSILQNGRHIFVYGGNFRSQNFELSIAPAADDRTEGGAFIQDTWQVHDQVLITAGIRGDGFSVLDNAVWSPRVGVNFRPIAGEDQVVRVSFGRGYRAPSAINNFLDTVIFNTVDLGVPGVPLYSFPIFAVGNPDLVEEKLDQIEVGYRGVFNGNVAVDFSYYYTETKDNIDFFPQTFYSAFDPPPNYPLFIPVPGIGLVPAVPPNTFPKTFSYRNLGLIKNQGIELGVRGRVYAGNEVFANYTWQKDPEVEELDPSEINKPPTNTFNIGFAGRYEGFLYSATVNYVDEAFWADVLDSRFHGTTDAFTTLNLTFGYNYQGAELSVRATNVTDEPFQQHFFGDIIGRRVLGEVSYSFNWR